MLYISELRSRNNALINHHIFMKTRKNFKIHFNKLYKHLALSNNKTTILLEPVFSYGGQFFAKLSSFQSLLKSNDLVGFFLFRNNFKNQIGKNFFLTNYENNPDLLKFLKNEDHKNLFLLKQDLEQKEHSIKDLSLNIMFDINMLHILEIHKIFVLLHLISLK